MPAIPMQVAKAKDLAREMSSEQLLELNKFIVTMLKSRRKLTNLTAIDSFSVGDTVITGSTLRPAKWAGVRGKVARIKQTKVVIRLESAAGQYFGSLLTVPASALTLVAKK